MSVQSSDLVIYGSQVMPEGDDATGIGGAIDQTRRVSFNDLAANDTLNVASSDGGDSMEVTITGRNDQGQIISETLTLNGTTTINGSTTFERIMKATLATAATGTVTITEASGGAELVAFAPGELEVRRPFYDAQAEATSGSERTYYEKVFLRNNSSSNALLKAIIKETEDPTGLVDFDLEGSLDGSDSNGAGNNRQIAPSGYSFDSIAKDVVSGDLPTGSAQGIWLRLTLPAGEDPQNTHFTLQADGATT